jgi:dienelactone hydrolase
MAHDNACKSRRLLAKRTGESERSRVRKSRRLRGSRGFRLLVCCLLALAICGVGWVSSTGRSPDAAASGRRLTKIEPASARPPFAVGLRITRLIDPTRMIRFPNGRTEPRTLVTYVRYPALGASSAVDLAGAPAARAAGPFPLIVFGHGYAVTPAIYAALLRTWTRAGYVVAAPVFPLENADAPGGPNEADLDNQPADIRLVISRLLAANGAAGGPLRGMIEPARIAVAGHSDGGETAVATAYDRRYRDTRIDAAIILSGAELSGKFTFPHRSPALLATQGTADTINLPINTDAFFDLAPRPKFLLTLLGAKHLPPYTSQQPQLGIVERVTTAFLDHYLKQAPLQPLLSAARVPGAAELIADP